MSKPENGGESFMTKLATFIVDKRNLIFLIVVIGLIFSFFSSNWVSVENSLSAYLPDDCDTTRGLAIMDDQFVTYGTADVMVANVTEAQAEDLLEQIEASDGVLMVTYNDSSSHYNNAAALYSITFSYPEDDEDCLTALQAVEDLLADYDVYVSTDLGNQESEIIASEISVIIVYVAIIVVAVLLLTSSTYAEIPVLLLTFVVAMVLNTGTNFLMGTISFVSNSVTSILQLALSLDYAIILCNRYKEEHAYLPVREAAITALSKAIPEIGAGSLTTIGGLLAMVFMQFKLGPDMGVCLIKAILFALLSVFLFMPGLLVLFGPWMDKTKHKKLLPDIPIVGKFAWKTRKIVPPIFALLVVAGILISQHCPYAYGYSGLTTPKLNDTQIAENMINDTFGESNFLAVVIPAGDYDKETDLISQLEAMPEVDSVTGMADIEAMDGYMVTDKLNPREFSELADVDYELAELLYSAYAANNGAYGELLGNVSTYQVPLIDIFTYVWQLSDSGVITLTDAQQEMIDSAYTQLTAARQQLQGEDYSRLLVYLSVPPQDQYSYVIDDIKAMAQNEYPDGTIYVAGNMTMQYDFQKSFSRDNIVVSVVSILIVLVVLLFNFKSTGMPILLILVIQGSIWINFSIPTITDSKLFFLSYLIVSSIQMGANIDYAIVIGSRYMELKKEMPLRDAIIDTMNFAFPTIITSGTILTVAGALIGSMTSEVCIAGIGTALARGTIISMFLVMFCLPQILLLGGGIIEKTSFSMPERTIRRHIRGRTVIDGTVRGEIHGTISGIVHAVVEGDVNVMMVAGKMDEENTVFRRLPDYIDETPVKDEGSQPPTEPAPPQEAEAAPEAENNNRGGEQA